MEKIGTEEDERKRLDLGPDSEMDNRQTSLVFFGHDLMSTKEIILFIDISGNKCTI